MKAYKNKSGCIMAVFKDRNDTYGVYCRKSENDDFKKVEKLRYPARTTRAEAEQDMREAALVRSFDKTWELIDFRG